MYEIDLFKNVNYIFKQYVVIKMITKNVRRNKTYIYVY